MKPVPLLVLLMFSPAVIVAVHALFSRLLKAVSRQQVAVLAGLVGMIPMAFLLRMFAFSDPQEGGVCLAALYCFLVYVCVAYSYFHLFNMSETARRIRILREIYTAGSLKAEGILAIYNACDVVEVRINRLIAIGQIEEREGRYVLKGRVLHRVARLIDAWRSLLGF